MNDFVTNLKMLYLLASSSGYVDIVNALIKAGANLDLQDESGTSALMMGD